MELIETSFVQVPTGFEHTIIFEFEQRQFRALVVETQDETFVQDCFHVIPMGNLVVIDIPKYFGSFKSDVFTFIYDNVQKGFPS